MDQAARASERDVSSSRSLHTSTLWNSTGLSRTPTPCFIWVYMVVAFSQAFSLTSFLLLVQFCDLRPFSYCPGGALSDMLLLRHSQNTTFGGLPLYTCSIPKTGMGSNCIHDELSFGHIWAVTICPKSTPRSFVSSSSPQSATF